MRNFFDTQRINCEAGSVTLPDEAKFRIFENKALRKICGPAVGTYGRHGHALQSPLCPLIVYKLSHFFLIFFCLF